MTLFYIGAGIGLVSLLVVVTKDLTGKIKAGDLCAKGGEAAGGQPVAAGDIQDVLPGSGRQQRGKRGPAQKIQDVYKKPYIFRLTFPTKLANFKKALLFPKVSPAF